MKQCFSSQPVGEMRVKETIGIFEDDDDADLVQATDDQGKAEDVNEDSNDLAPISALKPLEGKYQNLQIILVKSQPVP